MENKYPELMEALKKYVPQITTVGTTHVGNEIPKKKKETAINSYAQNVDVDQVLALVDCTVAGTGKEGILFTTSSVYIKSPFCECVSVKYEEIISAMVTDSTSYNAITKKIKDKKDCDCTLQIACRGGNHLEITSTYFNKTPLKALMWSLRNLADQERVAQNDKYLVIEDLDDRQKWAYLSAVVSFANAAGPITAVELNQIYSLCVRIKTSPELRQKIMSDLSQTKPVDYFLDILEEGITKTSLKAVYISLIKDSFVVSGIKGLLTNKTQSMYLQNIRQRANITPSAIYVIQESIDNEQKYIEGKISENQYVEAVKKLAAGAAGAGVPIAALYLSGSVVGLSAAGITSGLATLGLGGVLGLSSMVTGVGVLVLLGVATYGGVKAATQSKAKINQRDLLIKAALQANEKVIIALIDDLNYITTQLVEVTMHNETNIATIQRLTEKIRILKDAFAHSVAKRDNVKDYSALTEEGTNYE